MNAQGWDPHGPESLLRRADALFLARDRCWSLSFKVKGERYRASFAYPGTVTVFRQSDGRLMARSLPGGPATVDRLRTASLR